MNISQFKLDLLSEFRIVNHISSVGQDMYARLALLEDIVGVLRNQALYTAAKGPYTHPPYPPAS